MQASAREKLQTAEEGLPSIPRPIRNSLSSFSLMQSNRGNGKGGL